MRALVLTLATTTLIAAPAALIAGTAQAKSIGFESNIEQRLTTPVKVEVVLSESMQHRADNLPDDLSKRGTGVRSRSGFANNGFYGERSLNELIEEVEEEIAEDFADRDLVIDKNATQTLRITIVDAQNNRPTFEQLSREPSLSFESFGVGGIELAAELIDASDTVIGEMSYSWFETNLQNGFARSAGTWTDARRGISRFSRRAAKSLASGSVS